MTTGPYKVIDIDEPDDDAPCVCSACDWHGPAEETKDIDDCILTPGDPSPVGRCPVKDCGALAYLKDKP